MDICVLGNIASGKSTLTRLAAAAIPNSVAIPEVFSENPFLPLYTADRCRWGFTNALRYYYDYARVYAERTAGRSFAYCFIDAGGATNREVYGKYLVGEGIVTPEEYAFYETLCDVLKCAFNYPNPDAFIFLDASPETCFSRMHSRGWEYQTQNLTLEYLSAVARYIAAFKTQLVQRGARVLTLSSEELDFTSSEGQAAAVWRIRVFLSDSQNS